MARGFERYTANFTAQASAAITADADSTGAQTDYDKTTGGNIDGCDRGMIEIDVTAPPATAASCTIYAEPLEFDGAGYAAQRRIGSVSIDTTVKKYSVEVDIPGEKGRITLHAVDYGFTAAAALRGIYIADA